MIICASDFIEGSSPFALFLEAKKRRIPCSYVHRQGKELKCESHKIAITNNGRWIKNWGNVNLKVNTTHGESWLGDARPESGVDLYLMSSEWMRQMFLRNGFHPSALVITGKPRMDFLYENARNRNSLPVPEGIDRNKQTLMYAPTWPREPFGGGKKGFFANWFSTPEQEMEALRHFLLAVRKYDLNLIIRLHGHYAKRFKNQVPDYIYEVLQYQPNVRISSMLTEPNSFAELVWADILISDYSSIATDFLGLDRPVLFIPEGCGWVYNATGKWFFNPADRGVMGDMIADYRDFERIIGEALEKPERHSEDRRRFFEMQHGVMDGQISKRALDEILRRAG